MRFVYYIIIYSCRCAGRIRATQFSDSKREEAAYPRKRTLLYLYNIVCTNKKVGPRTGGRLSLRAGRACSCCARLPGAAQSHLYNIYYYDSPQAHDYTYNVYCNALQSRASTYTYRRGVYSRNTYCNILFFPYIR